MTAFYAVFVGFEVGSVYALWAGERNGVNWPKQMYGWITSALLVLGLLPQYWEIYTARRVVGISIVFMLVDIFGGVFSGVSLFFRSELDSTALVQYMLVVVLDGIVVLLKPILDWRMRRIRRRTGLDEETGAPEDADDATQAGDEIVVPGAAGKDSEVLREKSAFNNGAGVGGRTLTGNSDMTVMIDGGKE